jgi:hypothetical protein
MSVRERTQRLVGLLDELGYGPPLLEFEVVPPGMDRASRLDIVAFTRTAPHDLRTSAIAGGSEAAGGIDRLLDLARSIAAPFAIFDGENDEQVLYQVGTARTDDREIGRFVDDDRRASLLQSFRRVLEPAVLQQAKTGTRQLTLFPIDARLLDVARHRSVGSVRSRLETAFAATVEAKLRPEVAAQLVVNALTCVVVDHKYGKRSTTATEMVSGALQRHGSYFELLAQWEAERPELVRTVITELSESLDYGAVDARSLNSVYEALFLTPALRKKLGIFYTPPEFANRILESLPIEELEPEDRCVYDPACGSGNLLLATQERLEALAPGTWTDQETHAWLKTHLVGSDVDGVATLLAKHSLLVSALPMGNTWNVITADFVEAPPTLDIIPTLIVTNPPWHLMKGSRRELATRFLHRALDMLADDGFLACILPSSWLTTDVHRGSRAEVAERCDIFEIWRLPRDVFPNARFGCAVLFARKRPVPSRRFLTYRWINAGADRRNLFIEHGVPSYRALMPTPAAGAPISWGPLDDFFLAKPSGGRLADVAPIESGVVQRGDLPVGLRPSQRRIPFLARGAEPPIYGTVPSEAITWLDSAEQLVASEAKLERLRLAPKLLVQADRFPDNPWRCRPVLDLTGAVPVGLWHAVLPDDEGTAFALLALLASMPVSAWYHTHAAKRITVGQLEDLPLPADFRKQRRKLERLGRRLAASRVDQRVLAEIDELTTAAYGFDPATLASVRTMMAGFEAPEGHPRVPEHPLELPAHADPAPSRAAAVVGRAGRRLQIWSVDGPDDGVLLDLPVHMPGWLTEIGSTFDLEGDPASGRYTFHRSAYMASGDSHEGNGERRG